MSVWNLIDGISTYSLQQLRDYGIVTGMISDELTGLFGTETLSDMAHIIHMYDIYQNGADFTADSTGDYTPSRLNFKYIKELIDKEARFLFSASPDIRVESKDLTQKDSTETNQELLEAVLKQNKFSSKLVRAARDYLIGKRIAIALNVNETDGITISFVPSLEFVYETDPTNVDKIVKFIQFYSTVVNDDALQQRIYKKKWFVDESGYVVVNEGLYDGNGDLIEEIMPDTITEFKRIPVAVVINGGLTGDPFGVSDVEYLQDTESIYSKLSSKDIDSLRKGMDQIVVLMDVNPHTSSGLSRAAGALWDLSSDPASEGKTGSANTLDNSMTYSGALDTTLERLKVSMYGALDIPDTSNEGIQGIITSGKAMRAVYWGLITRCNEKMLDWKPAFEFIVDEIMHAATYYPNVGNMYVEVSNLSEEYNVVVDNNYPILEDELEEKDADRSDVVSQTMSRKSYMKKWRLLTDEEAEEELNQIALEAQMFSEMNMGYPAPGEILNAEGETTLEDEIE